MSGLHLQQEAKLAGGKTKEDALLDRHSTNLAKTPLDFLS